MKKVKTYLFAVMFILMTAVMGACSCGGPDITVVDLKITAMSDNLVFDENTGEYMVLQGEEFSITYSLLPDNATDNTVYVDVTPSNKLNYDDSIVKANSKAVKFQAGVENKGSVVISFTSKDGSKKQEVKINVVAPSDLTKLSTPSGLKYNEQTSKFEWNAMTDAGGDLENVAGYQLSISDGSGENKVISITEKVGETYPTEYGYSLESGVTYFVKIRALGKLGDKTYNSDYSSSTKFYVLPSPTNLKNDKGIISWDYAEKDKISGYEITFGNGIKVNNLIAPSITQFDITKYMKDNDISLTSFNVQVRVVNNDFNPGRDDGGFTTYIMSSRANPQISITQLASPTGLKYTMKQPVNSCVGEAQVSWSAVTGANSYDVSVYDFGTTNIVKQELNKAGTSLSLGGLSAGKYTISITAIGDDDKTIGGDQAQTTSHFVMLPILTGDVKYSQNSLELSLTELTNLIGAGNISSLMLEAYSKTAGQSYDNSTGKSLVNAGQSVDLTIFNYETPYWVLVRPVVKDSGADDATITIGETEFNVVSVSFDDNDASCSSSISQLLPANVLSVSNLGVVKFSDENTISPAEIYKYAIFLLNDGDETKKVIENILVADGGLLSVDDSDSTIKLFNLYDVFVGLLGDADDYEVKVVPMSNLKIDASSSASVTRYYSFKKLQTISDITIGNNNTISWQAVEGADHYEIQINSGDVHIVTDCEYEVTETLLEYNTIRIKAIGDDETAINSEVALFENIGRASGITGLKVVNGVLTWNAGVVNSKYYLTVSIDGFEAVDTILNTNSFDGLSGISFSSSATITIKHGIENGTGMSFNSEISTPIRLTRLNIVDVANSFEIINNTSTARFLAIVGAESYKAIIRKSGVTKTIYLTSDSSKVNDDTLLFSTTDVVGEGGTFTYVMFSLPELASGDYSISIQAVPVDQTAVVSSDDSGDYIDFKIISEYSGLAHFSVYPQVGNVVSNGNLAWSFGQSNYLQDFVITFLDGTYKNKTIVTTNYYVDFDVIAEEGGDLEIAGGTYNISIMARASVANVVYPTPTTLTVTKLSKPVLALNSENKITFSTVTNASGYRIYQNGELLNNGTDYTLVVDGSTVVVSGLGIEYGMEYSYSVKAIANNNFLNSGLSSEITLSMLTSPLNAVKNGAILTWDDVENASGYMVLFDSKSTVCSDKQYTLPALAEAGAYTFQVVALGGKLVEGVYMLNSNPLNVVVNRLSGATGLSVSNNTFYFGYSGDAKPSKYKLYLEHFNSDTEEWVAELLEEVDYVEGVTNSYDLHQITAYDGFKLKVVCLGSDENFTLDGAETYFSGTINGVEKQTFEKVLTPSLNYEDGVLTLSHEDDYMGYEVYVKVESDFQLLPTSDYSISADHVLTLSNTFDEDVVICVRAKASGASGKIDSNLSSEITINAISAISDFGIYRNESSGETSDYAGTFRWTASENASGYNIYFKLSTEANFDEEMFQYVDGGSTSSYSFEAIFLSKGLQEGKDYNFAIVALGHQTSGENIVCYLNSKKSSLVKARCVSGVGTLNMKNGVLSWSAVTGVTGYLVQVQYMNGSELTTALDQVITTTSIDLGGRAELTSGISYTAKVIPVSTKNTSYIIVNSTGEGDEATAGVKTAQISFSRYGILEGVKVENGILKITLRAEDETTFDAVSNYFQAYINLGETEEDGEDEDEIELPEKYYGYLMLRIVTEGYENEDISPIKLQNAVFDKTNLLITYYYESQIKVKATTKLKLNICALGSTGKTGTEGIYLPSTYKTIEAYKYSAPVKTKVDNLTSLDGKISFTRVVDGKGNYVTKYLLKAISNKEIQVTDNTTTGSIMKINTLFADIETSGIVGENDATFVIANASDLTTCYYSGKTQNFYYYYYNSAGEKMNWVQDDNTTKLLNNEEYKFVLTTFGTADSEGMTDNIYLRSNAYETVTITYLYDYSAFTYRYESYGTNGGYLAWNSNEKCLGYELYVISETVALNNGYTTSNMNNSKWINLEDTHVYNIGVDETSFMFYNTENLGAGYYWCAMRPIGNGEDFITSPNVSNTIRVYKLSNPINAKLQNGAFRWEANTDEQSDGKVLGYKIFIYTYASEGRSQVALPSLVGTYSFAQGKYLNYDTTTGQFYYEIPEEVVVGSQTYKFLGLEGEKYGIGIIAIGGKVNDDQCVCSSVINVTNSGSGYERLRQVAISINTDFGQLEWNYTTNIEEYTSNTRSYTVYVEDVEQSGEYSAYLLSKFVTGGTYNVSVKANANGGESSSANYLNSIKSTNYTIVKFYDPKLKVVDGVVNWGNDQNGEALVPQSSSVVVKDYKDKIEVEKDNNLDGSVTSYKLGNGVEAGYYILSVKYNSYMDNSTDIPVYHIESETSEIKIYKLPAPTVESVEVLFEDSGRSEETGFGSSLKWELVKDGQNNLLESYRVELWVKDSNNEQFAYSGYVDFKPSARNVYIKTAGNAEAEYASTFDSTYLFEYNKITNTIYLNIGVQVLNGLVDVATLNGRTVQIRVISLGNTVEDISGEYEAIVNSSPHYSEVDFSTTAPEDAGSDVVNGIIRWSGSENPVRITYSYNSEFKTIWLGSSYIKQYGKVYYLPYVNNVTYGNVTVEFILNNSHFSNTRTITVGTVNLFESGEGTDTNPYIIKARNTSATESDKNDDISSQFANIQYRPNSVIKVDSSVESVTIGSWTAIDTFYGKLLGNASERDGNNVVLNNIILSMPSDAGSGEARISMFNTLSSESVISDIDMSFNVLIEGSGSSAVQNSVAISGIAFNNYGTLSNIKILKPSVERDYNIKVYSQNNVAFASAVIYNYGTMEKVSVDGDFLAILRTSAVKAVSTINSAGIAFTNYGIIDSCVMSGKINAGADNVSRALGRNVSGMVINNYALILNSDFNGILQGWSMAGVALNNYYFKSASESALTVSLSKTINKELVTKEYTGGTVLGCSSNGSYILANGNSYNNSDIFISGIVGRSEGGYIARCYSTLNKTYTKQTDVSANYTLSVELEKSGFNITRITDKNVIVYVGAIVSRAYVASVGESTNRLQISNSYAVYAINFENQKTEKLRQGTIIGFYSDVNSDYGIAGNIYYSTTINDPITGVVSDTAGTVKLSSASQIANYVSESAENSLNGDSTLSQVRKFVYNTELKLDY